MSLRIIPLGGLGEVGKNMTVYEHGDEIVVVDAGLAFPRDEHMGVDLILPDFDYLRSVDVLALKVTRRSGAPRMRSTTTTPVTATRAAAAGPATTTAAM